MIFFAFALALVSLPGGGAEPARLKAQQQSQQHVTLRVRLFDSATGFAVRPSRATAREASGGSVVFEMPAGDAQAAPGTGTPGNSLDILLPAGAYIFEIAAAGYRSSGAKLQADAAAPTRIDFYLDPLVPPSEIAPKRLRALHRPDATWFAGFVSDEEAGGPLPGVRVRAAGGALTTTTNARGFFEVPVPLPKGAPGIPTTDLVFDLAGYTAEAHQFVELQANSDWVYRVRLARGKGTRSVDERRNRGRGTPANPENAAASGPIAGAAWESAPAQAAPSTEPQTPPPTTNVPETIRVGRNCAGTTCPSVEVHSLETYVKHVLPAEWFSCWGSLAGGSGTNSLRAGAVGIRSYGTWYQQHPLNAAYDICDTTSCQVFGTQTSTNADQATDDTAGLVLVDAAGDIARTEHSAENNHTGCGDCLTGLCIFDPVCCGFAANGHGRGMCQYGSARWATGSRITTSFPCILGLTHSYGPKVWQEILQLYYPALFLSQGSTLRVGDRVRAMQTTEVRTAASASSTLICSAAIGGTGTIAAGPTPADSLTWWQIAWDNGTSGCPDGTVGWSAENSLLKVISSVSVTADASTFDFTATTGQASISPHGVMLREANRRAEAWTANTVTPWITMNTSSGTTPGLLSARVNLAGLSVGTHNGTITIQSPTSAFASFTVSVQLVLHDGPVGNVDRSVTATQRRVDGYDLLRLARAFGADPTKPNWDPAVNLVDTDANGNGVIDPSEMVIDANDLAEMARNFGRSG